MANNPTKLHKEGVTLFRAGNYAEALEKLEIALQNETDPKHIAEIYNDVGVTHKELEDFPVDDIGRFLKGCGMVITEHCGGASGPIWGSAFRSAAGYAKGKTELDLSAIEELFECAVNGIQKTGKAELGDKTLLDALIPAAESLKKSGISGENLAESAKKGAQAAVDGAEKTKKIVATKGRASYLGERSLGHPDAGAVAIGIIFTGIVEKLL